jgi:hypothetical protein
MAVPKEQETSPQHFSEQDIRDVFIALRLPTTGEPAFSQAPPMVPVISFAITGNSPPPPVSAS